MEHFLVHLSGQVFKVAAYTPDEYEAFSGRVMDSIFVAAIEVYWSDDDFHYTEHGAAVAPTDELAEILEIEDGTYEIDHERDLFLIKDWPPSTPPDVKKTNASGNDTEP